MNTEICKNCGKEFRWYEWGGGYPGGKDKESVDCPYCGAANGTVMTSGFIKTEKIVDPK